MISQYQQAKFRSVLSWCVPYRPSLLSKKSFSFPIPIQPVPGVQILGSLSSYVFEPRTSSGSERFSLLICLDTTKVCIAKCLYSYRDDLPKNLFKITAQGCKKKREVSRKHSEGWYFTIIKGKFWRIPLTGQQSYPVPFR